MPARHGHLSANHDDALPSLATGDLGGSATSSRPGRGIELWIHTSIAPFDCAAEQWFPAAAGDARAFELNGTTGWTAVTIKNAWTTAV